MANQLIQLKDANNNNLYPTNRPFYNITSQMTKTEYCKNLYAKTNGVMVVIDGSINTGTPDQANLVTGIPTSLRPGINYIPGTTFYLNFNDAEHHCVVAYGSGAIQYRGSTTTGSSGVSFHISWIIGQ